MFFCKLSHKRFHEVVNFCHKRKPINLGIVLLSCKGILIPASFVCFFSIVSQNVILVLCACLDDSEEAGWVPEQAGYSRIRLVNATSDGPPTRQSLHAFMRSLLKVAHMFILTQKVTTYQSATFINVSSVLAKCFCCSLKYERNSGGSCLSVLVPLKLG